MTQERVIDLIDHARNFHEQLSVYYEDLSSHTDKERVKILLNYLSEMEQRHEQALADYEESASQDVTDTWFQFETDLMSGDYPKPSDLTPDMDMNAILREALRMDQFISDLYREIIKRSHSKRIREVFTNLLETNEKEAKDLSRDFAHMSDW